MEISSSLKKLAKTLHQSGHDLFVVGGFVRDSLLKLNPNDIDLASNISPHKMMELCKNLNLKSTLVNEKLGTVHIHFDHDIYEYTPFRSESYISGHTPEKVKFVDDINIDAKRRDATINAIYYNIGKGEIIDPLNGQKDLKKGIIKCANLPTLTLKDDGLRILRLIRFANTFGFRYERKTKIALKNFSHNLKDISKERIITELKLIVSSDLRYKKDPHFVEDLVQTNSLKYLFNSTLTRMQKPKKTDIKKFYTLSEYSRLIGFYVMIIKCTQIGYLKLEQLHFLINSILGLNGIKESNENIKNTAKIYLIYENLEYNIDIVNASINYLTLSTSARDIIDINLTTNAKKRLNITIEKIKSHHLPLGVHELDISSSDLIDLGINEIFISKILSTLYTQVIEMKVLNQKKDLSEFAIQINQTFIGLYKEKK